MKKWQLTLFLVTMLSIQIFANSNFSSSVSAQTKPTVYFGVDLSYGDVAETKVMIDQVHSFTNLVVVGTSRITWHPDKLTEAFQYAYDNGLILHEFAASLHVWSRRRSMVRACKQHVG